MQVFTGLVAVHIRPESSAADALRREGYIMIYVLTPVHQQLRVVIICPFTGAPYYFPADAPRLWTESTFYYNL